MKTAISMPDPIFLRAERLARRMRTSRSKLYQKAVLEFVARHDTEAVTEAMDRALRDIDTADDAFVVAAGRRALERIEW